MFYRGKRVDIQVTGWTCPILLTQYPPCYRDNNPKISSHRNFNSTTLFASVLKNLQKSTKSPNSKIQYKNLLEFKRCLWMQFWKRCVNRLFEIRMPDKDLHANRPLLPDLQNTFSLVYHKYFAIIIWIVAISCLVTGWTHFSYLCRFRAC